MSHQNLSTLLTSALAVGASEAAPSILDKVATDPSDISQVITQVLILFITVFKLFKKPKS